MKEELELELELEVCACGRSSHSSPTSLTPPPLTVLFPPLLPKLLPPRVVLPLPLLLSLVEEECVVGEPPLPPSGLVVEAPLSTGFLKDLLVLRGLLRLMLLLVALVVVVMVVFWGREVGRDVEERFTNPPSLESRGGGSVMSPPPPPPGEGVGYK